MRHPTKENSVFLVDIIDDAIDSVDICTYLLFNFFTHVVFSAPRKVAE